MKLDIGDSCEFKGTLRRVSNGHIIVVNGVEGIMGDLDAALLLDYIPNDPPLRHVETTPSPKEPYKFQAPCFQVGQVWLDREGVEVEITSINATEWGNVHVIRGNTGNSTRYYTTSGQYAANSIEHAFDLLYLFKLSQ